MSGRKSQRKGYVVEKQIVDEHINRGVYAERIPLSGAAKFRDTQSSDIEIYPYGKHDGKFISAEVKARKNGDGFKFINNSLGDNEMLILKQNHSRPIYCMTEELYFELMGRVA